ncbi:MAG: hypothetical protein PHG12_10365, partial [Sphaerochaeta sp.]|nr:hypothetical protein [Sphaerochaeta sp.]
MPDNKTPSTPRQYAPPNVGGIPKALQQSVRFCVWKTEERDGKCTKVPFNPRTGGRAMTNVPSTFSDFDTALMTYKASQDKLAPYLGLGINISDAIVVIDIDHCIAADGSIPDFAQDVLDIIGEAYVEFS